jgi:Na+/H+-dicarboxylate symporter
VSVALFSLFPIDQVAMSRIGALFGETAERVDIELALNVQLSTVAAAKQDAGWLAILPTNVFAALTANDSLRVIIFAAIFGAAMVMKERHSGTSIFSALEHIQGVCILIFKWFHFLTPIGVVALIAPQVAKLGPDIYSVLAPFAYTFVAVSILLMLIPALVVSIVLGLPRKMVFATLLEPIALGAATKNTLVCIPAALEALRDELRVPREPCELYVPIGFVTMQFGSMIFFIVGTLFIGQLMVHTFSVLDLMLVAAFSGLASFATIGSKGVYVLAPMALVLRPFGLSYELALPLMILVEPIANLLRVMLNVAWNCVIPVLAAGRKSPAVVAAAAPAT